MNELGARDKASFDSKELSLVMPHLFLFVARNAI